MLAKKKDVVVGLNCFPRDVAEEYGLLKTHKPFSLQSFGFREEQFIQLKQLNP